MSLEQPLFRPPGNAVPGVAVRPAAPADLDAVARIDAAAFDEDPAVARAWVGGHLGATPVTTALAEREDGTPVATGYAVRSGGDAGPCLYVAGIAVLPEARGAGIGAAVTAWLLARGFADGAALAHLHPDSDGAARLYGRLGFTETAGLEIYVGL